MSKNTHRIIIDINDDWVDIKSEELKISYGNGCGGHGLQCAYPGGTNNYNRMFEQLDRLANTSRKINDMMNNTEYLFEQKVIKNKNNMNANDKLKKWLEGI